MNAMTQHVVTPESMLHMLTTEMKFVAKTSIFTEPEERVEALEAQYRSNVFIKGVFSCEKNALGEYELFFKGEICDAKHQIRIL